MGDVANFPLSFIENHDFITDCARYAEGLYSEAAVKKKYHFDDATWEQLGSLGRVGAGNCTYNRSRCWKYRGSLYTKHPNLTLQL